MKHLKSLNEHLSDDDPTSNISEDLLFYYNVLNAAPGIFKNLTLFENKFLKSVSFDSSFNTKFSIVKYHNNQNWVITHNNAERLINDLNDVIDFLKKKTDLDRFSLAEIEMWQKALELDSSLFIICPTKILKKINPTLGTVKDIGVLDKD